MDTNPFTSTTKSSSAHLKSGRWAGAFPLIVLAIMSTSCQPDFISSQPSAGDLSEESKLRVSADDHDDYKMINSGGDLWCRYLKNNNGVFDFRVGGAGALSELRWIPTGYQALLSPSAYGEHTDRVIQTTWWLNSVKNENSTQDKRWNITQAGNQWGTFNPVNDVDLDKSNDIIDVYSYPKSQFVSQNDPVMNGGYKMLTRYEGLAKGVIKIRRVMIAQQPELRDNAKPYDQVYIEGWTPFRHSTDSFNTLALDLDNAGNPSRGFSADNAFASFPQFPIQYARTPVIKTQGYAIAFKNGQHRSHVFAALVFGKKDVVSANSGDSYVLSERSWDTGMGVLPGLTFNNMPVGSIIDQSFYLYVDGGLTANTADYLDKLVTQLPAPRVYYPSASLPVALADIVKTIKQKTSGSGKRIETLAAMAGL